MSRQAVVVVGADGRIGHLLCSMQSGRWDPIPVTRTSDPVGLAEPRSGPRVPIVLCPRNDDLLDLLPRIHPSWHADLVFVQNGLIRSWLVEQGLEGGADLQPDRCVLWVAVPRRGDAPIPGGASVFSGHWAETLAQMLDSHGVDARAVDRAELAREEAIKLAWICATGVLGSATGHGVGGIDAHHAADLEELVRELYAVVRVCPGLDIDVETLVGRIQAYSARIPHFPARLKEWRWRNGAVLEVARKAALPTPVHDHWLQRAGGAPTG